MKYWIDIPTLGHRVPSEEKRLGLPIIIRAEVYCENEYFKLDIDMLGVRDKSVANFIGEDLGLSKENEVHYLPYEGGRIVQDYNLIPHDVFRLNPLGYNEAIGLFKGHVFCNEVAKAALEPYGSPQSFIAVENDDVGQFLWNGNHLLNTSPAVKQMLLKGIRQNWDEIT